MLRALSDVLFRHCWDQLGLGLGLSLGHRLGLSLCLCLGLFLGSFKAIKYLGN